MDFASLLAQDDPSNSADIIIQLAVLLLIPAAIYYLLIRPKRR